MNLCTKFQGNPFIICLDISLKITNVKRWDQKSQEITKVFTIHPLRIMNTCLKKKIIKLKKSDANPSSKLYPDVGTIEEKLRNIESKFLFQFLWQCQPIAVDIFNSMLTRMTLASVAWLIMLLINNSPPKKLKKPHLCSIKSYYQYVFSLPVKM